MRSKYLTLIYAISAAVVFAVLAVLAGLYDMDVSNKLAVLDKGEYYSESGFGRFAEIFGEMPLYLFLAYAFSVVFWNAFYFGKTPVKYGVGIPFLLAVAVVSYMVPSKINEYMIRHGLLSYGSEGVKIFFEIALSLGIAVISLAGVMLSGKQAIRRQLSFAVVIMFTAALSQAITQGMKLVNKRVRFRAMNELGDFSYFTPWYKINGYPDEFKRVVELLDKSDAIRSFPSGHTAAASITYTLLALPYISKRLDNVWGRVAVYVVSIGYTAMIAIGRIVVGAHYFSDVLFGGSLGFLFAALSVWLVYKRRSVKPLASYCGL